MIFNIKQVSSHYKGLPNIVLHHGIHMKFIKVFVIV